MKTIYLLDENWNEIAFNYEDISDLKDGKRTKFL